MSEEIPEIPSQEEEKTLINKLASFNPKNDDKTAFNDKLFQLLREATENNFDIKTQILEQHGEHIYGYIWEYARTERNYAVHQTIPSLEDQKERDLYIQHLSKAWIQYDKNIVPELVKDKNTAKIIITGVINSLTPNSASDLLDNLLTLNEIQDVKIENGIVRQKYESILDSNNKLLKHKFIRDALFSPDENNRTILHDIAEKFPASIELLKHLLSNKDALKGASSIIDLQDKNGDTALHIFMRAASQGKENITNFKEVLDRFVTLTPEKTDERLKANILIRNKEGKLASELLGNKFSTEIKPIKERELDEAIIKIADKIVKDGITKKDEKDKVIKSLKKASKDGKYADLYKEIATDYPIAAVYKKFINDCKQELINGKTFKLGKGYQSYLDLRIDSIVNNLQMRRSEENSENKLLDSSERKTQLHELIERLPECKDTLNKFLGNGGGVREIVNYRDENGNTAAHLLMAKTIDEQRDLEPAKYNEILIKLVNLGANLTIKNNQGLTPIECAENLKGKELNVAITQTIASCIKHIATAIAEKDVIGNNEEKISRIEKALTDANKSHKFDGLYHKLAGDVNHESNQAIITLCANAVLNQKSSLVEKFTKIFNKLLPKGMDIKPDLQLKRVLQDYNKPTGITR